MNGTCIECLSEWVWLICYPTGNNGKGNGICQNCANTYKLTDFGPLPEGIQEAIPMEDDCKCDCEDDFEF